MSFSFENFERNQNLANMGITMPRVQKTGTTICGVCFKDGVVMGCDTRATSGSIIAEKNTIKLHYLADHIYCCGAGTSADTNKVTRMFASQLELHRLLTGKPAPIVAAIRMIKQHLFKYHGHIGASLIVGGVDADGPKICQVAPHGSTASYQYNASGSGCLAAGSVLEARWQPDMNLEDAKKLVRDAIAAGCFNDSASGNRIDLCVITKDGAQYLRPYEIIHVKKATEKSYIFKPKSTAIISRTVKPIKIENTTVRQLDVEPMEVL